MGFYLGYSRLSRVVRVARLHYSGGGGGKLCIAWEWNPGYNGEKQGLKSWDQGTGIRDQLGGGRTVADRLG